MSTPSPERAAAWARRRTAPCFHHALLLQRAELHTWGEPQTNSTRAPPPHFTAFRTAMAPTSPVRRGWVPPQGEASTTPPPAAINR